MDPEDAEVRKEKSVALFSNKVSYQGKEPNSFPKVLEQERFKHSSSLSRLKRNIVLIQRMIEKNRTNQQFNWRPVSGPPMVKEMCLAEEIILKSVQFWNFNEEIQVLQNLSGEDRMFQNRQNAHTRNKKLKQTSSLFRLDPFLDEKGVLRVGGRLQNAALAYEVKHPIIIPKKSHLTELLIRHYHNQEQHHQGCGMTHNAVTPSRSNSESARSVESSADQRKSKRWQTSRKNVLLPPHLSHILVWTHLVPGTLKRAGRY